MKVKPVEQNPNMIKLVAETEYEECLLERFFSMECKIFQLSKPNKERFPTELKTMDLVFKESSQN